MDWRKAEVVLEEIWVFADDVASNVRAISLGAHRRTAARQAEKALGLYTSVFPGSRTEGILRHDRSDPEAAGHCQARPVRPAGRNIHGYGECAPAFGFTEATPFMVACDKQDEIDHFWSALSAVPEAEQCSVCGQHLTPVWVLGPRSARRRTWARTPRDVTLAEPG